jgi:PKD repeat protein
MQRSSSLLAIAALAATAAAQTIVIPNGMAAAEGSTSNAFPWGRGGLGIRIQTIYDSSHFTLQGVTTPVLITGLRWRPNTNVSSLASTQTTGSTVKLSTCPIDQGAVTTSHAGNRGWEFELDDNFSGVVSWPATAAVVGPCPFLISTPFTNSFLYDPNAGDLNIETDIPIQTFTGTSLQLDVHGTAPLASRVYLTTNYPTGVPVVGLNHGVVVEVSYTPAIGNFPRLTGTPRSGPINTLVNFTDKSFTSDPGGITGWAWDVDGVPGTDYVTQNCAHNYTSEGSYSVSLTMTSALGSNTVTRNGYVSIDAVDASFTTATGPGTLAVFTDTSTGGPTSWAWDFTNDGITDSTAQNPAFVYPSPGVYTCRLTVSDAFSNDTTTSTVALEIIPQPAYVSTFASATATRGFWFQSPTRFSVVAARVPDETNNGTQNVAIYRLAAAPPVFSLTASGGLEFVSLGQPSANNIPCVVSFDVGEFVGVLGACGTTTMQNSYGTPLGLIPSSVLGSPCTLTRFGTQFNINTTGAVHPYWQEPGANVSRVWLGVTACAAIPYGTGSPSGLGPVAPTMKGTALPYIGQTAVHQVTQNDALVLQIMVGGFGRLAIPLPPFGTILIGSIDLIDVMNGGAPVGPGTTTWSFAVPPNPALIGQSINWQNANIVIPTGQWSLSNGVEWWINNPL